MGTITETVHEKLTEWWQLGKGAFGLASEVGMSEHDFLTLEWPYGGLNEDLQDHEE